MDSDVGGAALTANLTFGRGRGSMAPSHYEQLEPVVDLVDGVRIDQVPKANGTRVQRDLKDSHEEGRLLGDPFPRLQSLILASAFLQCLQKLAAKKLSPGLVMARQGFGEPTALEGALLL